MTTYSTIQTPANRWLALDGLRGIMTMFVFLAHVDYDLFPGSIIYMDTFFLMSSFFITRLLQKDLLTTGRIDFKRFYIRRAKRLFPALVIVVFATLAISLYLGRGNDNGLYIFGALFYFSNWLRALEVTHNGILGHTWSLSIEEQYYLVWPVILAFLMRHHWQGKKLMLLLLSISIVSSAWRAYLALKGVHIDRTYNGTDVRLDSLALGAMLALCYDAKWMQKWLKILTKPWLLWLLLLFLAVGGGVVDYRETRWYVWQQPIFALISLAFIIGLLQLSDGSGLKLIFQNRVSVYLGTICYGIYLWHYPILVIASEYLHLSNWDKILFCGPLTIVLASASYFFIEKPVLQSRSKNYAHLQKNVGKVNLPALEP